jgi:WXG100 family type VII secretion target
MTIRFTAPEFHASVAEVRHAAASLSSTRSHAAAEVETLLDGWHGAAATAFAEAWSEWLRCSREVESSLDGLAESLALFQTDITLVDADSAAAVARLAGRLS